MMRIWDENAGKAQLKLSGSEHNHLAFVLRAKVGDGVIALRGDEFDYFYIIESISKKESVLTLIDKRKNECNPARELSVYLAVITNDNLALACQKLNEIGATRLVLFSSAYSQKQKINLSRLAEIARQSCKQCGRSLPLRISFLGDIKNLNPEIKNKKIAFLDNYAKKSAKPNFSKFDGIIVGPEGGFTEAEREFIASFTTPISFGDRILRAETAAIVGTGACLLG
ncbi:MAG: 16S rRNA (uracil(1498)-N(3))-methyltransferase [Christensenellaceae bacterium]|jgi:16S rRNA (uracil1498-N3)-methyltransferase|nr:16S rRNA (uracil(1498)-N(3))-methyltransferase [Christensenellaceae bacterium]